MRQRVLKELETNDPPIVPGQLWIAKDEAGKVTRRILILAQYPLDIGMRKINSYEGRLWLYEECAGGIYKTEIGRIGTCPEFNLRYVFQLEN